MHILRDQGGKPSITCQSYKQMRSNESIKLAACHGSHTRPCMKHLTASQRPLVSHPKASRSWHTTFTSAAPGGHARPHEEPHRSEVRPSQTPQELSHKATEVPGTEGFSLWTAQTTGRDGPQTDGAAATDQRKRPGSGSSNLAILPNLLLNFEYSKTHASQL